MTKYISHIYLGIYNFCLLRKYFACIFQENNSSGKCKKLLGRRKLKYKTALGTEADVQNFPLWVAILASNFVGQLKFQIWKSSSLFEVCRNGSPARIVGEI